MSTPMVHQWNDHHENSTAVSRDHPLFRQVSEADAVIGIRSSALIAMFDMIWVFDLIQLTVFDLIRLTLFDWIQLIFFD